MKTILFPTDFSANAQHALGFAIYLAQQASARLCVQHVYMTPIVDAPHATSSMIASLVEAAKEQAEKNMSEFLTGLELKHPWLKFESFVEHGFVVENVIAKAEEIKCDYIVMGTRGASNLIDKMIGSNAQGVIEKSKCPVFAIPDKAKSDEIKSVLYAADYEGDEKEKIREVLDFAKFFGAEVHVLHIRDRDEPEVFSSKGIADRLKEAFEGEQITFRNLVRDDVKEGLDVYIENQRPDVLVLATHRRNYFESLFHRSITKHFAQSSKTPILALHK